MLSDHDRCSFIEDTSHHTVGCHERCARIVRVRQTDQACVHQAACALCLNFMHITAGQGVGNHLDGGALKTQTRQRYRGSHIGVARVLQRSLTGRAAKKCDCLRQRAQIKLLLGGTAGPGLRRLSRAVSDLPQAGQACRRQPVHAANGTGRQ